MNYPVVKCEKGHLASADVVEDMGGCPYCLYTPGERQAAIRSRESLLKRLKKEGRVK